ncbi:type III secretion inner membrane ring lipoprotein SctJ [Chelativorans sp. SCAU2101]|jgi:type III secretion apparatus lipoprotein, YscJ/HrcJ family|uniref:Lipoprotein n=1 Tax=Chelativorans petroleitrophicus TaxID=2975484 RepID=A0A9X2X836_9HYPH|nr:type III secretion inner membrane ring lipoprotein SctJ [Chelativorans petroleitrophicus]MCT8989881.1 type III secretion inner membrane ring lipoprotein SctJ [Chelativorans petroleitrophicus]
MRRTLCTLLPVGAGRMRCRAVRLRGILLSCLLCVLLSGCKVPLYSGLGEQEANEMLGKLLEYNIDATKQTGEANQVTLLVDEAQFGQAVDLLQKLGLPRPHYETIGKVFTGDGLVTSPMQEWARFNFALSQELSSMVSSIPGVISAEVRVANPRKETPFDEAQPPSASVLALVKRDAITAELVPQIKQLVAYGIENIEYDRVGVVVSPVDPPARPAVELVTFGGVVMQRGSVTRALFLLGAIALLGVALGAAGGFVAENYLKTRGKKAA